MTCAILTLFAAKFAQNFGGSGTKPLRGPSPREEERWGNFPSLRGIRSMERALHNPRSPTHLSLDSTYYRISDIALLSPPSASSPSPPPSFLCLWCQGCGPGTLPWTMGPVVWMRVQGRPVKADMDQQPPKEKCLPTRATTLTLNPLYRLRLKAKKIDYR